MTQNIRFESLGVTAQLSAFLPEAAEATAEFHLIFHVDPRAESFASQSERLALAEKELREGDLLAGACAVFRRYFLSDAANQAALLPSPDCATAIVQQPPLDGSKVILWLYLQRGSEVSHDGTQTVAVHNGYRHLYHMGLISPEGDSYAQTLALLDKYETALSAQGASLPAHCVRTWFNVVDVDNQYAGLVRARRERFARLGLTAQTHYIASTGIGGGSAEPAAIVQLGGYALLGFEPTRQRYLYAPSHLNPTSEYGVTFERGTVMEFGDRAEVYISGTASIDNQGQVVHVGDIRRQTLRMWENVEALLYEAETSWEDVAQMIVYLRDVGDYAVVESMFHERFGTLPCAIVWAPVCRPAWLIEMECIAIPRRRNPRFRPL